MDGEGTEQGGARGLMGRQRCARGGDSNCVSGTPSPQKQALESERRKHYVPCVHSGLGEIGPGTRTLAEAALLLGLCTPLFPPWDHS